MTDVYGANLYNRYLAQQHALTTHSQVVTQGFGNPVRTGDKELVSSAAECRSILVGLQESRKTNPESQTSMRSMLMGHFWIRLVLPAGLGRLLIANKMVLFVCVLCPQVCTGVYDPLRHDQNRPTAEAMFCGHRDQVLESELVEPHHVVEDVEAAVELLLQENSVTFKP